MASIDPVELLEPLRRIMLRSATLVRGCYRHGTAVSRKADGTPVTQADLRVDTFLRHALGELLEDAGWLSEESGPEGSRLEREWVWVVDPLDGTKEFARGIPEFAVSVGLVRNGEPVLGGVMNPVTCEGGVGSVGGVTDFWGFPAADVEAQTLDTAVACVSRSEAEDGSVVPYLELVGETVAIGSVAYKLLRVAAGVDDLTFSVQAKSEWDICGGVALLCAAGKAFRRLDGEPISFNRPDTRIRSATAAAAGPLLREFEARWAEQRQPCGAGIGR